VLTYHVLPGKLMAADLTTTNVKTLNGKELAIKVVAGKVTVGSANVTKADIEARRCDPRHRRRPCSVKTFLRGRGKPSRVALGFCVKGNWLIKSLDLTTPDPINRIDSYCVILNDDLILTRGVIIEPLAKRAEADLKRLGYNNVRVLAGDGYQGWADHAPFDAIIVTCAPDQIPQPLVGQLRDGGRMIIPVGPPDNQQLYLCRSTV
jgi:hypothetical protein